MKTFNQFVESLENRQMFSVADGIFFEQGFLQVSAVAGNNVISVTGVGRPEIPPGEEKSIRRADITVVRNGVKFSFSDVNTVEINCIPGADDIVRVQNSNTMGDVYVPIIVNLGEGSNSLIVSNYNGEVFGSAYSYMPTYTGRNVFNAINAVTTNTITRNSRFSVNGSPGNDIIFGSIGDDGLFGGEGNDVIFGFAGNDTLSGGLGTNQLYGGTGDDTFVVYPVRGFNPLFNDPNTMSGRDIISGGVGNDKVERWFNSESPIAPTYNFRTIFNDVEVITDRDLADCPDDSKCG